MQAKTGSTLRRVLLVLGALALAIWSDTREPPSEGPPAPVSAPPAQR